MARRGWLRRRELVAAVVLTAPADASAWRAPVTNKFARHRGRTLQDAWMNTDRTWMNTERHRESPGMTHSLYPLHQPDVVGACMCDPVMGEGWSSDEDRCVRGTTTSCVECPYQAKCAYIQDFVGDGLRAFDGDCKYAHQPGMCTLARSSSLSYPVELVFDQWDNLFIADYGNNRVRMVEADTQFIVTVAGTGEVGFHGDGGPGRLAKLRYPEGVAVLPWIDPETQDPTQQPREVYFSDFLNQRVRRVRFVLDHGHYAGEGTWYIDTVIGTGVRGPSAGCDDCDNGCDPLTANLFQPRALAFSSNQVLYLVDSGNRQIMKYSVDTNKICVYIGQRSSETVSVLDYDGLLLAGHYEAPNRNVVLESILKLAIDRDDNLWFSDANDNRIFFAPLNDFSYDSTTGFVGKFVDYFLAHFVELPALKDTYESDILRGLAAWLIKENIQVLWEDDLGVPREQGNSYWMYAAPEKGTWCEAMGKDRRQCKPKVGQHTKFSMVQGLCFDVANNMFITDMGQSEILQLFDEKTTTVTVASEAARYTTKNCPCLEKFVDPEERLLPSLWEIKRCSICNPPGRFNEIGIWEPAPEENCVINPAWSAKLGLPGEVRDQSDLRSNETTFYPDDHRLEGKIVECTTTDFCAAPNDANPVEWCYLNLEAAAEQGVDMEDQPPCANEGMVGTWGYCQKSGLGIEWTKVGPPTYPGGAALLGNELRLERSIVTNKPIWEMLKGNLTDDLWLLQHQGLTDIEDGIAVYLAKWSMLFAFWDPDELSDLGDDPNLRSDCTDPLGEPLPCCGLKRRAFLDPDTGSLRTNPNIYNVGPLEEDHQYHCIVETYADLETLNRYPFGAGRQFWFIWQELNAVELTTGDVESGTPPKTISDCFDRCGQDPLCKGFMVKCRDGDQTDPVHPSKCVDEADELCVLFSSALPYYAYEIDVNDINRTLLATDGGTHMNYLVTQRFQGPIEPLTRFFGNVSDIYVAHDLYRTQGLIGGPILNRSLLRQECMKECIRVVGCSSIAFPGCYLMNRTGLMPMSNPESIPTRPVVRTAVYIKDFASFQVKGVSGLPGVYAYQGTGGRADEGLVNKPSSCALDSKGDLVFSDTWNQRVRKITNLHQDCSHQRSQKVSKQDIEEYVAILQETEAVCQASQKADEFRVAQYQTVEEHDPSDVMESTLCRFSDAARYMMFDLPLNLMVLCRACNSVLESVQAFEGMEAGMPVPCPDANLCMCRDKITQVLQTRAYLNCPMQHAYFDKWHRFVTGFIQCWISAEDRRRAIHFQGGNTEETLDQTQGEEVHLEAVESCILRNKIRLIENILRPNEPLPLECCPADHTRTCENNQGSGLPEGEGARRMFICCDDPNTPENEGDLSTMDGQQIAAAMSGAVLSGADVSAYQPITIPTVPTSGPTSARCPVSAAAVCCSNPAGVCPTTTTTTTTISENATNASNASSG